MDLLGALQAIVAYFVTTTLPPILSHVVGALVILIVGAWAMSVVTRILVIGAKRSHVKPAQVDLLSAAVTVAGWVLIAAGILQALNLNELAIAVGGSISLVALGIAAAASGNLGDIIAGVFLASDPDFGNGFVIKSGEIRGTVEHLDLRKTRIRAEDGKLHVVPNKAIESNVWIVEKRPAELPPLIHHPTIPPIPSILRGRHKDDADPGQQA